MSIYDELGIEPIINAGGTLTALGGSLMPPKVLEAMASAADAFVDMSQLHLAAGRRIAALAEVEAAAVCDGAAAGIALMAAACMTGTDRERIAQLPDTAGMKNRFVVQASHRNPFDQSLRVAGGEFVQVEADAEALRVAVRDEGVAAVFFTHAWFCMGPALSLPEVVEIAHAAGVPVMVDAAAEVPPLENLSRFVHEGADLVTFSGGKAIRGPQASGFILGRKDLVEACRLNDCPNMGLGRPMKVGKEEIAGLVRALELYVARDHAADLALWEGRVRTIIAGVAPVPTVRAWRQMPYGVGQQIPHAAVTWDVETVGADHVEVMERLRRGRPSVAVQYVSPENYYWSTFTEPELRLHPHTLKEGEAEIVARRLREALGG